MRYYIDSRKIGEFINKCNNYIEEMRQESKVMKDLINKTTWQGNARDAASLKYNKIMEKVDDVPEKLTLYIKFMEIVVNNYGESFEKIMKDFKDVVEKLELEKVKNEL